MSHRAQQDCLIPRDAFWTKIVEKKFNDAGFAPVVDLRGYLDSVSSGEPPAKRWTGSQLKRQYAETRALFPLAHKNGADRDKCP